MEFNMGGFLVGSFLGGRHTTVVENNTKVVYERPMTPTEIAEHEERLRIIREHSPKVKVALVRELTEKDFIGMPMTKKNMDRYNDLSNKILKAMCKNCEETFHKYGKRCAWRSLSNDHCFDGMDTREAREEIKKQFDEFQTKIAREQV